MKTNPRAIKNQLEQAREHTVKDMHIAATGLQGIGRLLASIPHEEGVSQLSDLQLEELGYAILGLSGNICSEVEMIEGALEAAMEGLKS